MLCWKITRAADKRLQLKFHWSRLLAAYFSADGRTGCGYFCLLIIEEVGHEGFGQLTKAGNLVHHKSFYDMVAGAPDIARLEIECHLDVLGWKISRFGPRTKESGHINDTPYNFPY